MVFPGGAREALKHPNAGEKYKLLWDDKQVRKLLLVFMNLSVSSLIVRESYSSFVVALCAE